MNSSRQPSAAPADAAAEPSQTHVPAALRYTEFRPERTTRSGRRRVVQAAKAPSSSREGSPTTANTEQPAPVPEAVASASPQAAPAAAPPPEPVNDRRSASRRASRSKSQAAAEAATAIDSAQAVPVSGRYRTRAATRAASVAPSADIGESRLASVAPSVSGRGTPLASPTDSRRPRTRRSAPVPDAVLDLSAALVRPGVPRRTRAPRKSRERSGDRPETDVSAIASPTVELDTQQPRPQPSPEASSTSPLPPVETPEPEEAPVEVEVVPPWVPYADESRGPVDPIASFLAALPEAELASAPTPYVRPPLLQVAKHALVRRRAQQDAVAEAAKTVISTALGWRESVREQQIASFSIDE